MDSYSNVDESSTTNDNDKSHYNGDDYMSPEKVGDMGSGFGSTSPFFADVTLDICMAHDIAETPEAVTRKTYDPNRYVPSLAGIPAMPPLPERQGQKGRQGSILSGRLDDTHTKRHVPQPKIFQNSVDPSNDSDHHEDQKIPPSSLTHNHDYDSNDVGNPMSIESDDFDNDNNVMARFTSNNSPGGRFRPFGNTNGNWRTRLQRKKWPKDISWAVAFWTVAPIGILAPLILYGGSSRSSTTSASPDKNTSWLAAATSPRSATLHTLMWGLVFAAALLPRLLYRTSGGVGAGDDARHFASQILLVSAPVAAGVYLALVVATYHWLPSAFWPYGLIPLWYLARELYLFHRWKMTSTTPGGRQAYFQALACAALDILSRSLKRKALYRTLVMVIVVQFGVITIWRQSLLAALRSGSYVWTIIALVAGKWATGTVTRLLTLMACGGVSNWFAEQSSLLESMQQMEERGQSATDKDENEQGLTSGNGKIAAEDSMPEAYSMADASQYKSVFNPGMDGDYESDDEVFNDEDSDEDDNFAAGFLNDVAPSKLSTRRRRDEQRRRELRNARSSTVRQLLKSGLTVSFGSVAKCGLLGGFAQFVWSQIRKIDHARASLGGMRVMPVHGDGTEGNTEGIVPRITKVINLIARDFVRTHSDVAMSYVADYQMSYTRAAREVTLLLDEAGVEPIIHDDISTHISACVGGSVSGIIVLFTGSVLVHQRNRNDPNVADSAVALDMVIAFFFCYTLIFTVMEPLRASIKAVYVCFAQHPEALSQAFPLIFHRLSRMSQSNVQ